MSPKMGRPKKDVTKSVEIGLRLTKETADKLQRCADEMGTTRTAVIERGIDLVEAELKK